MNPKNKTRYKSLDRIASDPRVIEIWDESEDGHGLWLKLADGWNCEGGSLIHRWTVREMIEHFRWFVTEGEPN